MEHLECSFDGVKLNRILDSNFVFDEELRVNCTLTCVQRTLVRLQRLPEASHWWLQRLPEASLWWLAYSHLSHIEFFFYIKVLIFFLSTLWKSNEQPFVRFNDLSVSRTDQLCMRWATLTKLSLRAVDSNECFVLWRIAEASYPPLTMTTWTCTIAILNCYPAAESTPVYCLQKNTCSGLANYSWSFENAVCIVDLQCFRVCTPISVTLGAELFTAISTFNQRAWNRPCRLEYWISRDILLAWHHVTYSDFIWNYCCLFYDGCKQT